eukprot:8629149-Alexandrium_andersonii.AAC.1
MVVGSSPCADWCVLNTYVNHPRMDPAVVAERKRRTKVHLEFVVKIYLSQLEQGAHFLHEHPMTASSWDEDCVKHLKAWPEVQRGVGH